MSGTDRKPPLYIQTEWKAISEFPMYEINVNGIIRDIHEHIQKGTYTDSRGMEVVKFTKDGHRYLRTVEKLKRIAFSAIH